MAVMSAGCGSKDTANDAVTTEEAGDNGGEEETAGIYSAHYGVMFNDEEEMKYVFPFVPVDTPYAEAMMQVAGYDYTLDVSDASSYALTLVMTCGSEEEDSSMFMERTYVFSGSYTGEGDSYTLEAPEHLQFSQRTAGSFAATSGEGGADFWGPDGLSFDETYANEDGYNGCSDILSKVSPCVVTVSGSEITEFVLSEGTESEEGTEASEEVADPAVTADYVMYAPDWELVTMSFFDDGTCAFALMDYNIVEEGTWEYADGTLTVTKSDGSTCASEMDGDTLKLDYVSVTSDQMTGHFESTDYAGYFEK
jgi:hypothetical protein